MRSKRKVFAELQPFSTITEGREKEREMIRHAHKQTTCCVLLLHYLLYILAECTITIQDLMCG